MITSKTDQQLNDLWNQELIKQGTAILQYSQCPFKNDAVNTLSLTVTSFVSWAIITNEALNSTVWKG